MTIRTVIAAAGFAAFALAAPAFADDSGGAASAGMGASVALEGSEASARGDVVTGSVAVPLGAASAGVGSVAMGAEVAGAIVSAPIEAVFGTEPLPVAAETITAQPAPNVPYAPPAPAEEAQ